MSDDDSETPSVSFFSNRAKFIPGKCREGLKAAAELLQKIEEIQSSPKEGEQNKPKEEKSEQKLEELESFLEPIAKRVRKKRTSTTGLRSTGNSTEVAPTSEKSRRKSTGAVCSFDDELEKIRLSAAAKRRLKKQRDEMERELAIITAKNEKILQSTVELPTLEPTQTEILPEKILNLTITCLSKVKRFKCGENETFYKVFQEAAEFFELPPSEFLLCFEDRNIVETDTPNSISLTERNILEIIPYKVEDPAFFQEKSLTIKFQSNDTKAKTEITVNMMEKMKSIMEKYSTQRNLPLNDLQFEFDGEKLSGEETPVELGMEQGNIIDVRVFMPVAECSHSSNNDMPVASTSYASDDMPVASTSYASDDMPDASTSSASNNISMTLFDYTHTSDMPDASTSSSASNNISMTLFDYTYSSDYLPDDYLRKFITVDNDSNGSDVMIIE